MRASIQTNLSLFEFAYYVGYHPYFFAQVGKPADSLQRTGPQCNDVMYQYSYQNSDHHSREDIAQRIQEAEDLIASITGFFTAPRYVTNEKQPYPWTYDKRATTGFIQADGHLKSGKVDYKRIQAIGVRSQTQVGNDIALVYSDSDGDGILDTFTMTVPGLPAGTTADEIRVYFTPADRNNLPLDEFEIRPVAVSISGTTATITGHRALCVKPDLTFVFAPDNLDATVAANFITEADVYRQTTDPSDAGTLIWENVVPSVYAAWYATECTPPCQVQITTSCFGIREADAGFVYPRPAEYDADTAAFVKVCPPQARAPDRFTINYLAGYPRQSNGWVDRRFGRATALLAAALMKKKKCGCNGVMEYLWELRNLPLDDKGNLETTQAQLDRAAAYFGINRRGAVNAANLIKEFEGWEAIVF